MPATSAPSSNLCQTGITSPVVGSGPWSWSCDDNGSAIACFAPLSGATTWHVGPTETGANSAASPDAVFSLVHDGDTILIDACTYTTSGDAVVGANNLYITSVPSSGCTAPDPWNGTNPTHPVMALIQQTSGAIQKGLWDIDGNGITIDHIAFTGAAADSSDTNGAGLRIENSGDSTLTNDYFYANEDGILTAPVTGTITIANSEFYDNGLGGCVNDCTHNLYIGDDVTLVVTGSYFHDLCVTDPNGYCASSGAGHELKSRAAATTLANVRLFDNMNGQASYGIDIPQSGTISVTGCVIEKGPKAGNATMMDTGQNGNDGTLNASTGITVSGNTFVNDYGPNAVGLFNGSPTTAVVSGNSYYAVTASQETSGPVNAEGNTELTARPTLDTSSPVTCNPNP